jgi:hypothetical protein
MTAVCIDGDFEVEKALFPDTFKYIKRFPVEGEVYEVTTRKCDYGYTGVVIINIDCGSLPNGLPVAFREDRFAVLTKSDETLEIENKQNTN